MLICFIFNTSPRFPQFLLYVRCKSGVILYGEVSVMGIHTLTHVLKKMGNGKKMQLLNFMHESMYNRDVPDI